MQDINLNLEAQIEVPTQPLDLFALGLRIRLEAFVLNADASLDYLRANESEKLKRYLQTTILELQCLLNEFNLYDSLTQTEEA
ncbi:hypothetical protein [Microscilla marina]|uniref:Uncharacterized protein n=1 Tax=Microscilla marina ATCC 23134 TaxID=313606 RepID=A1ZGU8_MICM2|nr:hypothetical protein [Microscilla marina]EAY30217.1 hypothetical protein M23134_08039 [Microscilla marina ATCC 23134]